MLIEGVDLAEDKVQLGSIVRLGEWGPELRECQSEGLQMPVYGGECRTQCSEGELLRWVEC